MNEERRAKRVEFWPWDKLKAWEEDHAMSEAAKPWVVWDGIIVWDFCNTEKDAYIALGRELESSGE